MRPGLELLLLLAVAGVLSGLLPKTTGLVALCALVTSPSWSVLLLLLSPLPKPESDADSDWVLVYGAALGWPAAPPTSLVWPMVLLLPSLWAGDSQHLLLL